MINSKRGRYDHNSSRTRRHDGPHEEGSSRDWLVRASCDALVVQTLSQPTLIGARCI